MDAPSNRRFLSAYLTDDGEGGNVELRSVTVTDEPAGLGLPEYAVIWGHDPLVHGDRGLPHGVSLEVRHTLACARQHRRLDHLELATSADAVSSLLGTAPVTAPPSDGRRWVWDWETPTVEPRKSELGPIEHGPPGRVLEVR